MQIRIIGSPKSKDTRKAERFFRERGHRPHLLDPRKGHLAPGELRRFSRKFGPEQLVNVESETFRRQGLSYLKMSEMDLLERLVIHPELLIQPLVAVNTTLGLGWDEGFWREWLRAQRASG